MPTTYMINETSLDVNLFVHVPLLRDPEPMEMLKYEPSQIPVSETVGISITGQHDILALNSKFFVTLNSRDLWQCQKLSSVNFCRDIVSTLRPIDDLKETCLGSLREGNSNQIMKTCRNKKLVPLKFDMKKVESHRYVIYTREEDRAKIFCPDNHGNVVLDAEITIPTNIYTEIPIKNECFGKLLVNRRTFYPDSNFDSRENHASFDLHFHKSYLENIHGITSTKLEHIYALVDTVKTEVDISEIHQISQQIEKNLQYSMLQYSTAGGSGLMILALVISICILFRKSNKMESKLQEIKGNLPRSTC